MSRDDMFAALTKQQWCFMQRVSATSQETVELSRLSLSANGTYRAHSQFSDVVRPPQPPKPWNFAQTGPETGVLYLGNSDNVARRIVLFDFLPNGALLLYGLDDEFPELIYEVCARPPAAAAPEQRASSLPAIALEPFYRSLGGTTWVLASDVAGPGQPRQFEFLADGRVRTTFPAIACADRERFAAPGRPIASTTADFCRTEQPYHPDAFRRTGRFLVSSIHPYLPQAELGRERYLFLPVKSYRRNPDDAVDAADAVNAVDAIDGVLAYEPPIRRSPLPATIVVWNATSGSAYVESVSLTQHLVYWPDRPEKPVAEVWFGAALKPGQSVTRTFDLTVASLLEPRVFLYFHFRTGDGVSSTLVRHSY